MVKWQLLYVGCRFGRSGHQYPQEMSKNLILASIFASRQWRLVTNFFGIWNISSYYYSNWVVILEIFANSVELLLLSWVKLKLQVESFSRSGNVCWNIKWWNIIWQTTKLIIQITWNPIRNSQPLSTTEKT